jgi:hypothetical protein
MFFLFFFVVQSEIQEGEIAKNEDNLLSNLDRMLVGKKKVKLLAENSFLLLIFSDRVLASSPGWPQTLDSPTSASWVLGLQE